MIFQVIILREVSKLNQFSRTELLLGEDAMVKLSNAKIAVFGIGGVGGFVVEALVRAGIGSFDLIDDDKVSLSNINRQIIATRKTIGRPKVEVMKERILEINPKASVEMHQCFFLKETADQFDFSNYDYVVDAIDTVSGKLELVVRCEEKAIPIISCMGAGNKLDPTRFEVADIYKTSVCPLAKVMRKELAARGIKELKVVYSKEPAIKPLKDSNSSSKGNCECPPNTDMKVSAKRQTPGSVSFVPSVAGLIIAGEVIKDIVGIG